MLRTLSIRNYALINQLELEFGSGFNVITGETGAGKSILLGALGLVLGNRADLKSLRDPEEKCVVEAQFSIGEHLRSFFEEHELDFDTNSIIRREILPSGKSRAFVNDTPTTLQVVNALSDRLIDVHSQHQTLLLSDPKFQMDLLDAYANNREALQAYQARHKEVLDLSAQLEELRAYESEKGGDSDYLQFLYDELAAAQLKPKEEEGMLEELESLSNVEQIGQGLEEAHQRLEADEHGILTQLSRTAQVVQQLAPFSKRYQELYERLQSSRIELEDIASEVQSAQAELVADPERTQFLEARLARINGLEKKHQLEGTEALIAKREELERDLQNFADLDFKKAKLEQDLERALADRREAADNLHQSRSSVTEILAGEIHGILEELNMPDAQISLELEREERYSSRGNSHLRFAFSANKGMGLQNIEKIASGGELSRVMLSIKAIFARAKTLPSIIFDEIDSGVSGETAQRIGQILARMGADMQVIAITHLPQIAAKGSLHFKVEKSLEADRTTTHIRQLSAEMREVEIGRLLSGDRPSQAAMDNARELLKSKA